MGLDSDIIDPPSLSLPGILEIWGDTDTGKTQLAMQIGQQFPHLALFDLDRKGEPPATGRGRQGILVHPASAEEALNMLHQMIRVLAPGCFIFDTLAALTLQADLTRGYSPTVDPYRLSRLLVEHLRQLILPLYQQRSLLILVNQRRELAPESYYRPLGRHYPLFCAQHVLLTGYDGKFHGQLRNA